MISPEFRHCEQLDLSGPARQFISTNYGKQIEDILALFVKVFPLILICLHQAMDYGTICKAICWPQNRLLTSCPPHLNTRLILVSLKPSVNTSSSKCCPLVPLSLKLAYYLFYRNYRNMSSMSKYFVFGNNSVSTISD